jgi:hypothetical protein
MTTLQQRFENIHADEAGGAGKQDRHLETSENR